MKERLRCVSFFLHLPKLELESRDREVVFVTGRNREKKDTFSSSWYILKKMDLYSSLTTCAARKFVSRREIDKIPSLYSLSFLSSISILPPLHLGWIKIKKEIEWSVVVSLASILDAHLLWLLLLHSSVIITPRLLPPLQLPREISVELVYPTFSRIVVSNDDDITAVKVEEWEILLFDAFQVTSFLEVLIFRFNILSLPPSLPTLIVLKQEISVNENVTRSARQEKGRNRSLTSSVVINFHRIKNVSSFSFTLSLSLSLF